MWQASVIVLCCICCIAFFLSLSLKILLEWCCLSNSSVEAIDCLHFPCGWPSFLWQSLILLLSLTLQSLSNAGITDRNCTSSSYKDSWECFVLDNSSDGCCNDFCNNWSDKLFVATCSTCGKGSQNLILLYGFDMVPSMDFAMIYEKASRLKVTLSLLMSPFLFWFVVHQSKLGIGLL